MISQKLLQELKEILEHDYKVRLSMQEVAEIGVTLLRYFETLIEIKSKTNLEMKGGGLNER
ncbi:MAG: hypothetical protein UV74_C0001G0066 [Candidatus Woesebacteria bacterium GW2011_GWB1_43_14]|uniref:Uncharacterized protein n=1 Tax=Candidatus Woesebacteria bacterium GW2011_GWB1_43_14 TaxID=1618578 RepID=A0A0G1FVD7_9BACT|nr:MAG: hypothetical protein UT21_C0003G0039 [Candidatus Woesebacteria bacterium GW2011_GWA1_39_11b]KKS78219.1 MAG: hypothetical protein UV51_C0002G0055 [Candidatus Woesebacteria bacterium GW2011_GWC1_42_9]KKS98956.1 MAG: hypothetical protein UV74_C0001G0066 [Candidatus Woesebacteria bacterium GW2011_GWB1_43_14]